MTRYQVTFTTGDKVVKNDSSLLETMTGEWLYAHELREGMEVVFDALLFRVFSVDEV